MPQYRDRLTPSQIAQGINLALRNAARLANDARLLHSQGRTPSAVALAILSIEESGKVGVLRQMATAQEQKEFQALWKNYRSHTKKNVLWLLGQMVHRGARRLEDFKPLVDQASDHPEVLDQLKQLATYTDCFDGPKWSSPDQVDLLDLAPYLVMMAEVLARQKEVSTEEIELWQRHLMHVRGAPMTQQKKAVEAWYHDLKLRGYSDVDLESLQAFLAEPDGEAQA